MNKIIIPTGFMGSGSSVITDLLSEYKDYSDINGSFEYIFLHCPNGFFDLEDKLLKGNNAIRSDEAIYEFRKMMKYLFDRKFWWPGDYKNKLSKEYMNYVDEFLESLIDFKSDYFWYYQMLITKPQFVKLCFNKIIEKISFGLIRPKRPLLYDTMQLAFPTKEEYYKSSKVFLKRIYADLGIDKHNLILDQLLLPFNLDRMENYFEDNTECFVIYRDPRDVFISNKYVWAKQGSPVPYPSDVHEFCGIYKKMMERCSIPLNKHIHVFRFEDLVYHYDDSVKKIEEILGINSKEHIYVKEKFNPDRSIKNTQLFSKEEYKEEARIIEKELKDYIYEFPYEVKINMDEVF